MSALPANAHFLLHFGIGLACATFGLLPGTIAAIRSGAPSARELGRWLLAAYAAGILAAFPNILHAIGIPEAVTGGWWMNIFFLHPIIDRLKHGGRLLGELTVVACFCIHYCATISALLAAKHKKRHQSSVPLSTS